MFVYLLIRNPVIPPAAAANSFVNEDIDMCIGHELSLMTGLLSELLITVTGINTRNHSLLTVNKPLSRWGDMFARCKWWCMRV